MAFVVQAQGAAAVSQYDEEETLLVALETAADKLRRESGQVHHDCDATALLKQLRRADDGSQLHRALAALGAWFVGSDEVARLAETPLTEWPTVVDSITAEVLAPAEALLRESFACVPDATFLDIRALLLCVQAKARDECLLQHAQEMMHNKRAILEPSREAAELLEQHLTDLFAACELDKDVLKALIADLQSLQSAIRQSTKHFLGCEDNCIADFVASQTGDPRWLDLLTGWCACHAACAFARVTKCLNVAAVRWCTWKPSSMYLEWSTVEEPLDDEPEAESEANQVATAPPPETIQEAEEDQSSGAAAIDNIISQKQQQQPTSSTPHHEDDDSSNVTPQEANGSSSELTATSIVRDAGCHREMFARMVKRRVQEALLRVVASRGDEDATLSLRRISLISSLLDGTTTAAAASPAADFAAIIAQHQPSMADDTVNAYHRTSLTQKLVVYTQEFKSMDELIQKRATSKLAMRSSCIVDRNGVSPIATPLRADWFFLERSDATVSRTIDVRCIIGAHGDCMTVTALKLSTVFDVCRSLAVKFECVWLYREDTAVPAATVWGELTTETQLVLKTASPSCIGVLVRGAASVVTYHPQASLLVAACADYRHHDDAPLSLDDPYYTRTLLDVLGGRDECTVALAKSSTASCVAITGFGVFEYHASAGAVSLSEQLRRQFFARRSSSTALELRDDVSVSTDDDLVRKQHQLLVEAVSLSVTIYRGGSKEVRRYKSSIPMTSALQGPPTVADVLDHCPAPVAKPDSFLRNDDVLFFDENCPVILLPDSVVTPDCQLRGVVGGLPPITVSVLLADGVTTVESLFHSESTVSHVMTWLLQRNAASAIVGESHLALTTLDDVVLHDVTFGHHPTATEVDRIEQHVDPAGRIASFRLHFDMRIASFDVRPVEALDPFRRLRSTSVRLVARDDQRTSSMRVVMHRGAAAAASPSIDARLKFLTAHSAMLDVFADAMETAVDGEYLQVVAPELDGADVIVVEFVKRCLAVTVPIVVGSTTVIDAVRAAAWLVGMSEEQLMCGTTWWIFEEPHRRHPTTHREVEEDSEVRQLTTNNNMSRATLRSMALLFKGVDTTQPDVAALADNAAFDPTQDNCQEVPCAQHTRLCLW